MDMAYLILSILGTVIIGILWARAVIKAGMKEEGTPKQAIPAAFWGAALMIGGFLTLQLFARDLAVWTGYAHKVFGG